MTLPLLKVEDPTLQHNLDQIAKLFVDTGGRAIKVRFGAATVTWPGGANGSNYTTVTHGMGSTPVVVLATLNTGAGPTGYAEVDTVGATTFRVRGVDPFVVPALNTTDTAYWLAIG